MRRGDLLRLGPVGGRERGGGSSWQSLARGSGTIEADYLNGEIVLLGRLHGFADAGQRAAPAAREPVGGRAAGAGNAPGRRVRAGSLGSFAGP